VNVTVNNNVGGTLAASATLTNAFTYVPGGGAKKQRRVPSGRLQRQNSPSGEG
jgi:hypothetical protein